MKHALASCIRAVLIDTDNVVRFKERLQSLSLIHVSNVTRPNDLFITRIHQLSRKSSERYFLVWKSRRKNEDRGAARSVQRAKDVHICEYLVKSRNLSFHQRKEEKNLCDEARRSMHEVSFIQTRLLTTTAICSKDTTAVVV